MRSAEASPATAVQRLGVLLQAGVAPVAAWRAVADAGGASAGSGSAGPAGPVRRVAERVTAAYEIPRQLAEIARSPSTDPAWAAVAAAWAVAAVSGAPLGPTLERLAEVVRQSERAERQVRTALTGPVSTARILVVLPVAGLGLGMLLGFDTARILFTTPLGWACLGVGSVLLLAGGGWTRSLLRTARRRVAHPGLEAELVAIALTGGAGPDAALALVRASMADAGIAPDDAADGTLAFARASGVPASALLRAEAEDARHRVADEAETRAAALGVRMMLPLGVCILPSFVVLGVVPILLSLVGSLRLG